MKSRYLPQHLPAALGLLLMAHFCVAQTPGDSIPAGMHRVNRPKPVPSSMPPHGGNPLLGDPLPDLTADQRAAFAVDRGQFLEVETIETGLGPTFNNDSCAACHAQPAVGGFSSISVTRFGRLIDGGFDPLAAEGGSLLQEFGIAPAVREVIPADANVIAHRQTTPLFGLGLIEAIPDAVIVANAARKLGDGVHGHASLVIDIASGLQRVGRFGWKAQHATLLSFAGDAYLNEMGITNRLFPVENAPNGNEALLSQYDTVADPEDPPDPVTGLSDIDRFAEFMRFLAPPTPRAVTASVSTGRSVFQQSGCANCHEPSMVTGPNPVAALNNKQVFLYSDLLLHDMGTLGDGIAQADAATTEMRTAPLWGLSQRGPFLHDGRAATIDTAIRAHDGEAKAAAEHYVKLTPQARQHLLDFLNSL